MTQTVRDHLLVTAAGLTAELASDQPPFVLDVRWSLGETADAGRQRFRTGHVPHAVHADIGTVFTGHTGKGPDGRHPLPEPAALARDLAALGVAPTRRVVLVDEPGSFAAERAWWVLRWVGIDARILDGGIQSWVSGGLPVQTGDAVRVVPVSLFHLTAGQLPTATADEAAGTARQPDSTLIDVRDPQRYRGEMEPIDPVAGHIPGAVNVPASQLYSADGTLPDREQLVAMLRPDIHPSPTVYCGSGVSAAREVFAFATLSVDATLFPGSWSAWCSDPSRPVATGDES